MAKKYDGKAKKTQKMTRDGLVETNAVTGEERRVSQRGQDISLKNETPDQPVQRPSANFKHATQPRPPEGDQSFQPVTLGEYGGRDTDLRLDVPSGERRQDGLQGIDTRQEGIVPPASVSGQYDQKVVKHGSTSIDQEKRTAKAAKLRRQQRFHQAQYDADLEPYESPAYAGSPEPDDPVKFPDPGSVDDSAAPIKRKSRAREDKGRLMFDGERRIDSEKKNRQRGTTYSQKFADDNLPETKEQDEAAASSELPDSIQDSRALSGDDTMRDYGDGYEYTVDPRREEAVSGPELPVSIQKPARLQFGNDEKPPNDSSDTPEKRKYKKAQRKADKAAQQAKQAQQATPKEKRATFKREFDPQTQTMKRRLRFEETEKLIQRHVGGSLAGRPVKFAKDELINAVHQEIKKSEHENVGVQAFHKGEKLVERGARKAYRLQKTAPYRKAAKLQKEAVKKQSKAAVKKALAENPQLRSNLISRQYQKWKIKRQYAKAAKNAKRAGKTARNAGRVATRAVGKAVNAVRSNPKVLIILAVLFLLVMIISSIVSACSTIGSGALTAIGDASYTADASDINRAETVYNQWEVELQIKIRDTEKTYPGYDEYRCATRSHTNTIPQE